MSITHFTKLILAELSLVGYFVLMTYEELMCFLAQEGQSEAIQALYIDDPSVYSAYDNLPVILAAKNGHLNVLQVLFQYRDVDVNARNSEAFINAARAGHLDVVEWLLDMEPCEHAISTVKSFSLSEEVAELINAI